MGLDASVSCTCYQEGRVISPFPDLTYFDKDGWLDLNLPYEGHDEEYDVFEQWQETACPHSKMEYCSERIANWAGYRSFQAALEEAGWEHFPTLHVELPNANGGHTSASAAVLALQELETFKHLYQGSITALVNAQTGERLREYMALYNGIFRVGYGYQIGFDRNGFFILEGINTPIERFHSMRFEQRPLPAQEETPAAKALTLYTDLATKQQFACPLRVTEDETPCVLYVAERQQTPDDFAYILEPLTRIFQAAVETGNPVRWC